ncbi:MAG: hypothetical protein V2A34_13205 [Lentisphaerota bacterium]
MVKDPAYKEMIRAQQKATMGLSYGSLFEYLQAAGQDVEPLSELLVERMMSQMDLGMDMMDTSLSPTEKEKKQKAIADINTQYDQQIRDLLGPENFPIFQQYEQTQPERMQVNMFKPSLKGTDQLSEEQEHQLILSLYTERTNFYSTAGGYQMNQNVDVIFSEEAISKQMADRKALQARYAECARKVLQPAQFEQFKKSQEQQQAMEEMAMRMSLQMFGATNQATP